MAKSKPYGEATKNLLLHYYKKRCRERNIEFKISRDYFLRLTQEPCFYCGKKPNKVIKSQSNCGDYWYNGVDRIDSGKGYEFGNCVTCCTECNTAKMIMSPLEYYFHCKRVVEKLDMEMSTV